MFNVIFVPIQISTTVGGVLRKIVLGSPADVVDRLRIVKSST